MNIGLPELLIILAGLGCCLVAAVALGGLAFWLIRRNQNNAPPANPPA